MLQAGLSLAAAAAAARPAAHPPSLTPGRYNKLYTVTAQCPESEWDKYKDSFISTAKSLVTPHKAQIR